MILQVIRGIWQSFNLITWVMNLLSLL